MSRPEPRPALQRADDGLLHPAAPRVAAERHLHPTPHAPVAQTRPTTTPQDTGSASPTSAAARYTGKPAKLDVLIPKDLRKELRGLAERSGQSLDAVVTDALAQHLRSHS